ncbi:DUF6624 domain-containing protein [Plantactinospora sp. B6F1]|uniref:DUF6624 domain-containing protein n=1 Tax=Plantactinospora sp. B6F1 TaxID=3158971 RepID=UPI0010DFA534
MPDAALGAELVARMDSDQRARAEATGREVDPEVRARIEAVDVDNTAWLAALLDRHGWPRRSEVGEEASVAAWLLAQHADLDPGFQRRCLSLLAEAVRAGEAEPAHLAYLTDRTRLAEGRPQLYGTQFWYGPDGEGDLQPRPIEDPAGVDARRRDVGLEPLAEYARQLRSRDLSAAPSSTPSSSPEVER